MTLRRHLILVLTFSMVLGACAQDQPAFSVKKYTKTEDKNDFLVTIHTSLGDMKAVLYDETPLHRDNFLKLIKEGAYDSTIWHRVIKEFMIQGGGIDMKPNAPKKADRIPAEFDPRLFHVKGALAAARQGDRVNPEKASSWCQFYIVQGKTWTKDELTLDQQKLNAGIGKLLQNDKHLALREELIAMQEKRDFDGMNRLVMSKASLVESELGISVRKDVSQDRIDAYTTIGGAPHLDDAYTVFGQVVEGYDVIDKIAATKTIREKPIESLYLSIEVEEVPKKKLSKRYDISYPEK
ncbi:peptidylprolyl isomerase [Reichenbachiella sp.]|uniref:peptidylprolyl isomerase n=1 Tax=Reichenbachiella sp. TaxID=2184521 RepID=UPI003BB1169F